MEDISPPIPARRRRRRLAVSLRRLLEKLKTGGDVRARKIRRLRAAVRAQRYENEFKLSIAVDKMMNDI
ncbi:MAG TPA: hypothetical protein VFE47_16085 [Tepidisphaeraceae bacterium]|nr:hypothetical protein [Tepidisphaeraceae bacterium]